MGGEYQSVSLKKVALIGFTVGYFVPAIFYFAGAAEIKAVDSKQAKKSTLCETVEYGVNSGKLTVLKFEGMDITIKPKTRELATEDQSNKLHRINGHF